MKRPSDFSPRSTKAGEVFISWSGKHVVTRRGTRARRFLEQTSVTTLSLRRG